MQKKPLNPKAELLRLEALCNRAEHCSYEIAEKLRRKGYPQSQIDGMLERLIASRLIDDRRFAAAYVHSKFAYSSWGRIKIRNGLYAKRISAEIIDEVMEQEIDGRQYTLTAFKAVRAKLRSLPPDTDSLQARQKLMRFAASRGYETSLIFRILSSSALWKSAQ